MNLLQARWGLGSLGWCGVGLAALLWAGAGCDGSKVNALSHDAGTGGVVTETGGSGPGSGGQGGTAAGAGGNTAGTGGSNLGVDAGTKIPVGSTQCSDGIDNDKDGFVDSADPECTGPNDNDESTFATGIPGDNIDACKQDCFFDGNSGMGDDGCLWQLKCDPRSNEPKCSYDQKYAEQHASNDCSLSASQSQQCVSFCQKFVPNGCDCFGCCAVPGAPTPIRLADTCTAKDFGDPTKCPPCTQVTQCANPCDRCEICVGKPTVPADCGSTGAGGAGGTGGTDAGVPTDGGGIATCSGGYQSCIPGAGTGNCPTGTACVTGCCLPYVM
jgi:hypothetical protein